jgi:uncharacterized protein YlxW (UPF0749 family)
MSDQTGERPDLPGDDDAPPSAPSPDVPEAELAPGTDESGEPADGPGEPVQAVEPEGPVDGTEDGDASDDGTSAPEESDESDESDESSDPAAPGDPDPSDVPVPQDEAATEEAPETSTASTASGHPSGEDDVATELPDESVDSPSGAEVAPEDDAPEQGEPSPEDPATSSATSAPSEEPAATVRAEEADVEADVEAASAVPAASATSGWRRLGAALRPRASRSQVLAGVLCAALGFALVVQVQQSASDQLSSARQEDLVRLLDEVTDRAQQLGDEVSGLESTRDELESGSGQARSALELAEQRAESEGILSGRLPAQGPGVRVTIQDPGGALKASQMFNVLEELRNAGAEVVELNGVRLVTSTWFEDEGDTIVVDDTTLSSPYEWTVIGDPETMDRALEIPGGALATVRTAGAEASTVREDAVEITAVTPPQDPEFAQPERERD